MADGVYFHNQNTGDVTWDHPLDGPTRTKLAAAREAQAAKVSTAGHGISASVPDFAAVTGGKRPDGDGNGGAGLPRMVSHQGLLRGPTGHGSATDAEAKLASELEAARQARTEAEKELAAATRAREAESRERQLLTNMVESMQSQLADARQEARELRSSQSEMEK